MTAPLNYTTAIPAARSISEAQALLVRHGATRIALDYNDGSPSGMTFQLDTPHGPRVFTLPVDVDAMHRLLIAENKAGRIKSSHVTKADRASRAHAERVAWRVVKDWIAAQLTLIDAHMARLDQVMLPYLHVDGDNTLYQVYREREQSAIEGVR